MDPARDEKTFDFSGLKLKNDLRVWALKAAWYSLRASLRFHHHCHGEQERIKKCQERS